MLCINRVCLLARALILAELNLLPSASRDAIILVKMSARVERCMLGQYTAAVPCFTLCVKGQPCRRINEILTILMLANLTACLHITINDDSHSHFCQKAHPFFKGAWAGLLETQSWSR